MHDAAGCAAGTPVVSTDPDPRRFTRLNVGGFAARSAQAKAPLLTGNSGIGLVRNAGPKCTVRQRPQSGKLIRWTATNAFSPFIAC